MAFELNHRLTPSLRPGSHGNALIDPVAEACKEGGEPELLK